MNKIIIALLSISILNLLAFPVLADGKAKNNPNISLSSTQSRLSNQNFENTNKGIKNVNPDNSEMSMINLQSVVGKRATTIQTTTGMLKSINEDQKTVIGNIGR